MPKKIASAEALTSSTHEHNDIYNAVLGAMQMAADSEAPAVKVDHLFLVDAEGADLWALYLASLPEHERQHHTCHACRRFIERYGRLVRLTPEGRTVSFAFSNASLVPGIYQPAIKALCREVERAQVSDVHVTHETVWGTPLTGTWTHFAIRPPARLVWKRDKLKAAHQLAAEKREEFEMLSRSFGDYSIDVVRKALAMLKSEQIYRGTEHVPRMQWLLSLHEARAAATDNNARRNITWRAVAGAPAGWCHVRSSVVGTLLDDIVEGKPDAEAALAFGKKMHPLHYLRPQAPPRVGNIEQAEKIVEKLGISRSLERRFARLEDIEAIWVPKAPPAAAAPKGGVFDHLRPGAPPDKVQDTGTTAATMTWVKFARDILPDAETIEMQVPSWGAFCALVTAVHADAPPILQWDREDRRNPVSFYHYHGGSSCSTWRLSPTWTKVNAITQDPEFWYGNKGRDGRGERVIMILEGAVDYQNDEGGGGFFPECLKSELHEVRATLEAHAKRSRVQGWEQATACGHAVGSKRYVVTIRVVSRGMRTLYRIDRYE